MKVRVVGLILKYALVFFKSCTAFWFHSHLKISQCFHCKLLFGGFIIAIETCSWHIYTHTNTLVKEAEFKCQKVLY